MPSPAARPLRLVRWGAPVALGFGIVGLDWWQKPDVQYPGTLVSVPLLAAALGGPLATAGSGVLALALSYGIGLAESMRSTYDPNSETALTRLLIIVVLTVVAVVAARHRRRRERSAAQLATVADAAQLAILQPPPRRIGGLRCASTYRSATQLARIGGDLVAVVETPQGVRALVGDVQGKGLEAVRLAGYVLGSFRERAYDGMPLDELAVALDTTVRRASLGQEVFVTAALVQVDGATGALETVSCGHPAPYVVKPGSRRAQALPVTPGPPLGLLELVGPPEVFTGRLEPRDRLVLVTDGLLEARRPHLFSRDPAGPFIDTEALLAQHLAKGSLSAGLDGIVKGATK
ncbi:Stage II sporulation protein E (SpoIIE) [Quadrisphaera granulorum]|uniref:Stage II sporulation protein E n=1 Tax=Quadrisphaera granulorum TaxID=317664 RepID=A0A316AED4_9ACTN|nr:PP2C family protein-serine/threonine phosphatase [Quadrisphaera granulorum]PWJ55719.1 stage II sporulation protein E [Quadrisphaera granulorum]SZE95216.1 Stage II sporulation protein E (SpoIIE) [Quadrisphaera granulorum]